jgi:endonuclease-3
MQHRSAAGRLRGVLETLRRAHGRRSWSRSGSGVTELVATILSQNTSSVNSSSAYRQLRRRFRTWDRVARADVAEIERHIRTAGLSRVKAPRIRAILRQIRAETGRIDLEFLRDWPAENACEYLLRFKGVGPKTALCTLLFAFGLPVFPVDTHICRIARRLGVLAPGVPFDRAHEALAPLIAPADRYEMHVLLIAHGRTTCRAQHPRCDDCAVRPLCPYGKRSKRPSRNARS